VKDHWEMDLSELLSSAEQFKEKGTEFFKVILFVRSADLPSVA